MFEREEVEANVCIYREEGVWFVHGGCCYNII